MTLTDEEVRLQQLRNRRAALAASGDGDGAADLDEAIAEAEASSLTGDGSPRPGIAAEQAAAKIEGAARSLRNAMRRFGVPRDALA